MRNVNNWHWVDKNCLPWAKDYLSEKFSQVKAGSITVDTTDITGDVDLNQRKGKIVHIFDIEVNLKFKGISFNLATDSQAGKEVTGKIQIPEFMHDTALHEIVVR